MKKLIATLWKKYAKKLIYGSALVIGLLIGYVLLQAFFLESQTIVFLSNRDEVLGIYSMRTDGSNQKRLSDHQYNDSPRWSLDGTHIVYFARLDSEPEIFTMSANGMSKTRLTYNANFDAYAVWSPDGNHIAFMSGTQDGFWYLYVIDKNGKNLTRLALSQTVDSFPTWSPDSTNIAFINEYNLYTIHRDGTGLIRLIQAENGNPIWSPKGDKIVFICKSPQSNYELCAINPNGSGFVELTNDTRITISKAVWSPDGQKIAFDAFVIADNNYEVFVMNSDSSNLVRLTNNTAYDGDITWSPDNKRVAFTSNRDGNLEIYAINIDGTNLLRLTRNSVNDYSPSWQP
jgi:Tol biopolymer transport system component